MNLTRREEHPMDKFKDHLLGNKSLTAQRDIEYFEKMTFTWSQACKMYSPQQIITMVKERYSHEKTQAYKIIKDAFYLFGDTTEISKAGAKKVLIEGAHLALHLAMKEKNSEMIIKAITLLHKLYEFDKMEDTNLPPPSARMAAGTRVYQVTQNVQVNNYGAGTESQ